MKKEHEERIQKKINKIYSKVKSVSKGNNASYIPALDQVDPDKFGITFTTCNGQVFTAGDSNFEVAIESISKLFTLSKAISEFGTEHCLEKIGFHGSSLPFNSIIAADLSPSHTINPFVNQGAMATTSLFYDKYKKNLKNHILDNLNDFAGRKLKLGTDIYHSESETNSKNMALAYLLKSYNRFYGDVNVSVDAYTAQCSKMVNSVDLSVMACVFANEGVHPITNKNLLSEYQSDFITRGLAPEGLYEYSDTWIVQAGYAPAKSGVGGGILIIVPGIGGIGIVSPPLDKNGNSVKGLIGGRKLVKWLLKKKISKSHL